MPKHCPLKANASAKRSIEVDRAAVAVADRTVSLAFSSEAPYDRSWGREILDHSPTSINLARLKAGAPLLIDHDNSIRSQVGIVESVEIGADRVGRATVRFGKTALADEVFQQVSDGIVRNISVGYMIEDAVEESVDATGYPTVRITRWTPFEISCVSVPADFEGAGIGRAAETDTPFSKEHFAMTQVIENAAPDVAKLQAEARDAEKTRASTIIAIGEQFKMQGLAAEALRAGDSVEQFRVKAMDKLASQPLPAASSQLDLTANEQKRYSVLRAIRALVDRDWSGAGFERECHNAIMKRAGVADSGNGGFYVPYEVQKRDMSTQSNGAGGYLVATDNLASSFIDLLRNRAVVAQLGATMLTGLVGNVTIPKLTAGGTAYWLTNDTTAITESNQTLGQLSLSPKNVGAYTEVSRQLMMQSSPAADSLIMNDLAKVLAIAIDAAALEGNGSGAPVGIANTGSIGSVTGTSIDYAKILEFQTDVAGSNALAANCAYVTTPAVAALLLARQRFSSTDSPLWEGNVLDGKVSGFRAMSTLQVTAASMIFGDFSQVVIGEWGMLEIALNPYANFAAAISGIRAIQTVDVGIRYAGAFSRATSIT